MVSFFIFSPADPEIFYFASQRRLQSPRERRGNVGEQSVQMGGQSQWPQQHFTVQSGGKKQKKKQTLTLDADLLHLRHLCDRFLQVFHELEQLLGTLGAEVEYLLLVGAER